MADFDPPHGINNTTKRYPSHEEAKKGFDCGPADRDRFNGQLYRLEAELGAVIDWGGITQTNDRMTLVREALQSKLTPFLKSINGDVDGGTLSGDLFSFLMNDGKKWDLKLPEQTTPGFTMVPSRRIASRQSYTPGDHGTVSHNITLNSNEINAAHNNSPKYALLNVRARCHIHVSEKGHKYLNTRSICRVTKYPQYCLAQQGLDPTYSRWGFLPEMAPEDNSLFIVPVVNNKISFEGQLVLFRDHTGIIRAPGAGYYSFVGYIVHILGVG